MWVRVRCGTKYRKHFVGFGIFHIKKASLHLNHLKNGPFRNRESLEYLKTADSVHKKQNDFSFKIVNIPLPG